MDVKNEDPDENFNPWIVTNLDEFLFFCCPECDSQSPNKALFINHALIEHPKAREIIPNLEVDEVPLGFEDDKLRLESDSKVPTSVLNEEEIDLDLLDLLPEDDHEDNNIDDPDYETKVPNNKQIHTNNKQSKTNKQEEKQVLKDENDELQCYYCCQIFMRSAIEDHMRSEHGRYSVSMFGEKRPFQCQNCQCALAKDPSADMHICKPYYFKRRSRTSKVAKKEPIKCKVCCREFERQATLFNHMATAHSEERNFACSYCDFKAKISVVLKRHIKRKHHNELNFVCDICGKKFFEAYRLRLHEESHTKQRKKRAANSTLNMEQLPCDICHRSFLGIQALSVHKSVSHGVTCDESYDPKKTLTCDKCGKTFSTAKCLNDHCNQEHPSLEKIASVNCKCEAPCNLEFETAQELNSHLMICNVANSKKSEPLKNFACDKCNLSNWHSSNALRKHLAEAHGLVLTICDICGCALKSKYYLEDHKKSVHEGLKNYACSYCGKVFASKSTLNGHVGRMHETLARKFKCDKCDFSCLEPNKLKIHEDAVHAKSTRYECHLCKYFSFRKTGLQNHIKVVHEKYRPHKCDLCEMTFTYKRDKIKHMAKHPNTTNTILTQTA